MAEITIRTREDFEQVLQQIDNPEYFIENKLSIDPKTELRLSLAFTGGLFDAPQLVMSDTSSVEQTTVTVTTPVLRGILQIQEAVYDLYKLRMGEGYRLTKEDKQRLEIRIEFRKGSLLTDLVFNLPAEFFEIMTGSQAVISIVFLAVGWVTVSGLREWRQHKSEKLRTKLREYETEQETKRNQELQETTRTALEVVERVSSRALGAYQQMSRVDADRIEIQDETFTPAELREATRAPSTRHESAFRTVQGAFRIEQIDLSDEDETYIQARHVDSDELFPKVAVQKGQMSQNDYNLLKDAYKRDPVTMRIIVEERAGKIVQAYIDTSLELGGASE